MAESKLKLMTLPAEIRSQILSYCVDITHLDYQAGVWVSHQRRLNPCWWYKNYPDAFPEEWDAEPVTPSEQVKAAMAEIRSLSVLYVCRQMYREAIHLFYSENIFTFTYTKHFDVWTNTAREMGNLHSIRAVRFKICCFDQWVPNWRDWQAILEDDDRGLSWCLPGLKTLIVDFKREALTGKHADGDPTGSRPGFTPRQESFTSIRETLRRYVRVLKGTVWGLADRNLAKEMQREMMGLYDQ
ncbi:hypothetical protein MMC30_001541 [Trapelia coarctata]|nr:hypothetical protein [Trapelia coarctata]